jgi:hypothetical protein
MKESSIKSISYISKKTMSEPMDAEYSLEGEFYEAIRTQQTIQTRLKENNPTIAQDDLTQVYTDLHDSLLSLQKNDFAILSLRDNQYFCHVFLKTVESLVKTKSCDEHVSLLLTAYS